MKWCALLFLFAVGAAQAQTQPLRPWKGAATPAVQLAALDGAARTLEDYRGRVVLVNFWATWCAPCLEEMPSIERLRRSLDARRFAVVAINVGEGPRAVAAFAEKMGLGFDFLLDREMKTSKSWGARVLPASFIVGPDGAIKYTYTGAIDWSRPDVRAAIADLIRE
jgi:peroxiredoxin